MWKQKKYAPQSETYFCSIQTINLQAILLTRCEKRDYASKDNSSGPKGYQNVFEEKPINVEHLIA